MLLSLRGIYNFAVLTRSSLAVAKEWESHAQQQQQIQGLSSMSMSIMVTFTMAQSTANSHSLPDPTAVVETSFQVMAPVIGSDISGSQPGRPA